MSVVDDDDAVRLALGSLVRSMGFDVCLFESGAAFISSGQAIRTGCLISDIHMPGMSGLELHARLIAENIHLPTIFISAYVTPLLQAEVARCGALVLLEKPCSTTLLMNWIVAALDQS